MELSNDSPLDEGPLFEIARLDLEDEGAGLYPLAKDVIVVVLMYDGVDDTTEFPLAKKGAGRWRGTLTFTGILSVI